MEKIFDFSGCLPAHYPLGNDVLLELNGRHQHHLANDDSSNNEVERTQSYVGDAICDGVPLEWEYRQQYEGLTDEQIEEMSLAEIEDIELKRMEYYAFKVSLVGSMELLSRMAT